MPELTVAKPDPCVQPLSSDYCALMWAARCLQAVKDGDWWRAQIFARLVEECAREASETTGGGQS